jgi:hypothetical protein
VGSKKGCCILSKGSRAVLLLFGQSCSIQSASNFRETKKRNFTVVRDATSRKSRPRVGPAYQCIR